MSVTTWQLCPHSLQWSTTGGLVIYCPPRHYSPDQILAIQTAVPPQRPGNWLPSAESVFFRDGRRKQRKIAVVCNGAARLTTQPLNNLLQLPSSTRRSVSNLTAVVPSGDSHADHAFTATAHNSQMTMAYFNAQSVHQVAGEIHDTSRYVTARPLDSCTASLMSSWEERQSRSCPPTFLSQTYPTRSLISCMKRLQMFVECSTCVLFQHLLNHLQVPGCVLLDLFPRTW